jgi:hypothetical protein
MPMIDLEAWRQLANGRSVYEDVAEAPVSDGFRGLGAAPPPTSQDRDLVQRIYRELALLFDRAKAAHRKGESNLPEVWQERRPDHLDTALRMLRQDINWFQREIKQAPPPHRAKIAAAAIAMWPKTSLVVTDPDPENVFSRDEMERIFELQDAFPYPCAGLEERARLVMGYSPRTLAHDLLTKREAHQWLSCYPDGVFVQGEEIGNWYAEHFIGIPRDQIRRFEYAEILSDRRGLDWLRSVWNDPARRAALLRDRVMLGPEGAEIRGAFIDRLGELEPDDLVRSVEGSFRNAVNRLMEGVEKRFKPDEQLIEPPAWWEQTRKLNARYARLLNTRRELSNEGREMDHCSGLYAAPVADKRSIVISLKLPTCRSTVELDADDLKIRQHVGPGNTAPHPNCIRTLNRLHTEWKKVARFEGRYGESRSRRF